MASTRKKKEPEEPEHENAERWLLTYADMITLLVAFFIMMYSMSVMDLKKFNEVAISVRSGFSGDFSGKGIHAYAKKGAGTDVDSDPVITGAAPSTGPYGEKESGSSDLKRRLLIENYMKDQIAMLKLEKTVQPILDVDDNRGNRYRLIISDSIMFEPNSTHLSEDAKTKIRQTGQTIRDTSLLVQVEGYSRHTSSSNSPFSDSWQLSAERTRIVGAFLSDEVRINPRRISLINYGEWRSPDKTKKLGFSQSGEWIELDNRGAPDNTSDRVVISVIID
jgi:chemotaxis protein MotB